MSDRFPLCLLGIAHYPCQWALGTHQNGPLPIPVIHQNLMKLKKKIHQNCPCQIHESPLDPLKSIFRNTSIPWCSLHTPILYQWSGPGDNSGKWFRESILRSNLQLIMFLHPSDRPSVIIRPILWSNLKFEIGKYFVIYNFPLGPTYLYFDQWNHYVWPVMLKFDQYWSHLANRIPMVTRWADKVQIRRLG